jgi:hypothetical protein
MGLDGVKELRCHSDLFTEKQEIALDVTENIYFIDINQLEGNLWKMGSGAIVSVSIKKG